jgi:hypothetical protein
MDCSRAETKRVEWRVVGIIGNVACNRISPKSVSIVCRLLDCGVFRCIVACNTH